MKNIRLLKKIVVVALLAASASASAHPHPSFKHIGIGYKNFSPGDGIDTQGYVIEGGFKFTNHIFVEAAYTWIDDEVLIDGTTFDFDLRETSVFVGYRRMLTEHSDIYGKIGVANGQGQGELGSLLLTYADTSYAGALGYVYRFNSFQAGLEIQNIKQEGLSGEWAGGVELRWFFTDNWSIVAEHQLSDLQDATTVSVSYHF
jgi:hypothetical protein